ncbi:MAG: hypothetical protein WC068_04010 [Caulobacter sp.]
MNAIRSHILRLLIALVLPFMALAATASAASDAHPAMSGMAGCGEERSAPADCGLSCDMACPVTCVVVPAAPTLAEPLVHPDPVVFHSTRLDRGGISVRPDHPPPR